MGQFITGFTGIHHIAFATGDMEATVRYWRDLVGLPLVMTQGKPGNRQYFFAVSETDMISFFEWFAVQPVPYRRHGDPASGPYSFDHISLGVADVAQLHAMGDRLVEAGFPVSDVVDHGCFVSLYSYDVNHIPVEFSCSLPDRLAIRHHPQFAESLPLPVALEGSHPVPGHWPEPEKKLEEEPMIVTGEGFGLCG
ncbi:MAG: VOC family protein [Magnetococcus sp. DMHC-6]